MARTVKSTVRIIETFGWWVEQCYWHGSSSVGAIFRNAFAPQWQRDHLFSQDGVKEKSEDKAVNGSHFWALENCDRGRDKGAETDFLRWVPLRSGLFIPPEPETNHWNQ